MDANVDQAVKQASAPQFASVTLTAAPTLDGHAVPKSYVDGFVDQVVKIASEPTFTGLKVRSAADASKTAVLSANISSELAVRDGTMLPNVILAAKLTDSLQAQAAYTPSLWTLNENNGSVSTFAGGKLDLTGGATNTYIGWNFGTFPTTQGAVRFRWTCNYAGTPAPNIAMVMINTSGVRPLLTMWHAGTVPAVAPGKIITRTYEQASNTYDSDYSDLVYDFGIGTECEIEINWNISTRRIYAFLNGVRMTKAGGLLTWPDTAALPLTSIRFGAFNYNNVATNGLFRDLMVFNTCQHTAVESYVPAVWSIPAMKAINFAGGSVAGPLALTGPAPTMAAHAVPKSYVDGFVNQAVKTDSSPTFASLTLNGTLTGGSLDHVNLANKGNLTHAQIDGYLDQAVKVASEPKFARLTVSKDLDRTGIAANSALQPRLSTTTRTNVVFASRLANSFDACYTSGPSVSVVPDTISGTYAFVDQRLKFHSATDTYSYIRWNGVTSQGAIKFKYTHGKYQAFSQNILDLRADDATQNRSDLRVFFDRSNMSFKCAFYNSAGVAPPLLELVVSSKGRAEGTEYELELDWNFATHQAYCFVDGVSMNVAGIDITDTVALNKWIIGYSNGVRTYGSFRDLVLYSTTQHTTEASYVPGYSIEGLLKVEGSLNVAQNLICPNTYARNIYGTDGVVLSAKLYTDTIALVPSYSPTLAPNLSAGTPVFANLSCDLTGAANAMYIGWEGFGAVPVTGCLRFTYIPNYTLAPAATSSIVRIAATIGSDANTIEIYQLLTSGNLVLETRNNAGAVIASSTYDGATAGMVTGIPVEFELNWDRSLGILLVYGFIDGNTFTQSGVSINGVTSPDIVAIGSSFTKPCSGKYKDLVVYNTCMHTTEATYRVDMNDRSGNLLVENYIVSPSYISTLSFDTNVPGTPTVVRMHYVAFGGNVTITLVDPIELTVGGAADYVKSSTLPVRFRPFIKTTPYIAYGTAEAEATVSAALCSRVNLTINGMNGFIVIRPFATTGVFDALSTVKILAFTMTHVNCL